MSTKSLLEQVEACNLQGASTFRNGVGVTITILWFTSLIMLWFIMGLADVGFDRKLAVTGCLAFAPGFIAYGRVMGSSWTALTESSRMLSKGEPSAFYPYKPPARKQFVSTLVWINTAAMPFIAFNTLVSLILLAIDPTMFEHTQKVLIYQNTAHNQPSWKKVEFWDSMQLNSLQIFQNQELGFL